MIGDGSSVCFWDDLWTDSVLAQDHPRLVSFAINPNASVFEVMQAEDLDALFLLPLSQQAYEEFEALQVRLQTTRYDENETDKWTPIWGNAYTSQRFYSQAFANLAAHPIFRMIWKSRCTPRVKFFAWLVLVDRLNTKSMLQRRHLNVQDDALCIMCASGHEETIHHLFFECSFAKECWAKIQFQWDDLLPLMDRLMQAPMAQTLPFYTEATLIAAWELWKLRNDKVFQCREPTPNIWFSNFKSQCLLQSVRCIENIRSSFCVWLDAFS